MTTKRTCSLAGCDGTREAKGLCNKHYLKSKYTPKGPRSKRPLAQRFWSKVDKSGNCWEWTASKKPSGYGQINVDRRPEYAHRIAWELTIGPIPSGMEIDHKCWNPACVNPDHLQAVSRSENGQNRSGPASGSSSKFRGVSYDARRNQWRAFAGVAGKYFHGGNFATESEANIAAISLRNRLFTNNIADRISA